MRTLRLGHIELIPTEPKKIYFHYYSELKDYLSELGPEYKFTTELITSYIVKEFSKLRIYMNFSKIYKIRVVSQIGVVTNDERYVIIDDEIEIENFYKGEISLGFNDDGEEFDVHMDSCLSIEETETETCYIYREL